MGLWIDTIGDVPNIMKVRNIENGFVWVIGRIDSDDPNECNQWHIQGIATCEGDAVAMCNNESYFIGPVPLNVALPESRVEWVGSYFPLLKYTDATTRDSTNDHN